MPAEAAPASMADPVRPAGLPPAEIAIAPPPPPPKPKFLVPDGPVALERFADFPADPSRLRLGLLNRVPQVPELTRLGSLAGLEPAEQSRPPDPGGAGRVVHELALALGVGGGNPDT